jgi:predicted Zn finger-like uncharacterized protein
MIVVCPGCSAKFRVADEKVGPRGAKLRCSKCQTVFSALRAVEQPAPLPPPPPPDPFAAVEPAPPRVGPPPLPRRTTLDARAAFEVDLEPHQGQAPPPPDPFAATRGPEPEDPFAAPPAPASSAPPPEPADPFYSPPQGPEASPPVPDPFYAPAGEPEMRPPAADPFGALGPELGPSPPVAAPRAAAPAVSPTSFEDFDPFGPPDPALVEPAPHEPPIEEGLPDLPPPPRPYMAGTSGSGSLSLEELTTPPARRLSSPRPAEPAPMALLGATEDPFGPAPLGPGLSELDAGVITSSAGGGRAGAPFEPGPEYGAEGPIQIDPFAAAAVAADPLVVDEPSRGAGSAVAAAEAAPPETTAEAAVSRRAFQLRDVLVSAMALAALLLLSLAILVIWRGGLSPADALRPSAIVAALAPRAPTGALTASGLHSGLYERARGAPLLFVRGEVVSRAVAPLENVRVVVEVVRDGAVLARGEVPAGAVPGPEALHGALDAEALARALAEAAPPTGAPMAPGATVPFFIAFLDYPANLAGASLRVQPVAGPAR